MSDRFDVVIAGAGAVGAITALALAQQGWQVALLDARSQVTTWSREVTDRRVVALTWASQQLLQRLNVWDGVVLRRASPYTHMRVWDGQGTGVVDFDASDVAHDNLGHIVELSVLESSVNSALATFPNVVRLAGVRASSFQLLEHDTEVQLSDGRSLTARLLIAADGAQSSLREVAQIDIEEHDYQHHALVAQVHTELPHQCTAYQRFTEHGPLAFLPLSDPHSCSIVWSQTPAQTDAVLTLSPTAFEKALTQAFEAYLGAVTLQGDRLSFPLKMRHAKHYVSERLLLLGDAAHTMHPLAGQGLNLSLSDVAELINVMTTARQRQLDPGLTSTLRPFERRRRADNSAMLWSVGTLKTVFERTETPFVLLRNRGLAWVNNSAMLRRFFIGHAMGLYKRS